MAAPIQHEVGIIHHVVRSTVATERLLILGEASCGKTALLRALCGGQPAPRMQPHGAEQRRTIPIDTFERTLGASCLFQGEGAQRIDFPGGCSESTEAFSSLHLAVDEPGVSLDELMNDAEARAEVRSTLNTPLHQTADAIAKRAFLAHIDGLSDEMKAKGLLVTVGGCGAGKGFALVCAGGIEVGTTPLLVTFSASMDYFISWWV
jgi:hypothetical protein